VKALRAIPAVEKVLRALGDVGLPRPLVLDRVRRDLAARREAARRSRRARLPGFDELVRELRAGLVALERSRLRPVINGTGILIHTNLGRAPLGPDAVELLQRVAGGYTNLELDLVAGERGGRAAYVERALACLCGAEAATVVNNCAAALVLALRHFTAGERKEVILSRGELVQIGGGFRIPEILEASGARLREVGTTNRTVLADYRQAVRRETALILKVHRSNFFLGGFVASPATGELGELARRKRVPLVEDLGSGALVPTQKLAELEHEPTPAEALRQGVDLVCFSGDKLLGGPQAGILAGRARRITALKRDPFFRALRCDKLCLAALQATADRYLHDLDSGPGGVPVVEMLRVPGAELLARAGRMAAALADAPAQIQVGDGEARLGGGTLPRSTIRSVTIDVLPREGTPGEFAARLRSGRPPLIGYLGGGRFRIDLRTVFPQQDGEVVHALRAALIPPRP
jgi:L-seryl-tRNA(Ser) seleniumtransferase